MLWKLFFDFCYFFSFFIPGKKHRDYFRRVVLFDYKKKLYALKKAYYENAYRLVENKKVKAYINWLDKQLKRKR